MSEVDIAADDAQLLAVERVQGGVEERRKQSPVRSPAMSEILVIVVAFDMFNRQTWRLIDEPAVEATHKREAPRTPGQVVLGGHEMRGGAAVAVIAPYRLEPRARGRTGLRTGLRTQLRTGLQ